MQNKAKIKRIKGVLSWACICLSCVLMFVFALFSPRFTDDKARNYWLSNIIQQSYGLIAVIILMKCLNIRLFGKPRCLWVIVLGMIVAVDNFQWCSYFANNMQIVKKEWIDILLFALYCLFTGLFEECVFRGLVFTVFAKHFSKDKRGLVKTFVVSSVVFGLAHLLNLFGGANVGATLLQVGYTTLTGGLFAFVLIKTKNVLVSGGIHALYNFCGLLMVNGENYGLGTGVVFDIGTTVTMAVIGVVAGVIVLYFLYKYTEAERSVLYKRLGIDD